jgi:glycolate oxidase
MAGRGRERSGDQAAASRSVAIALRRRLGGKGVVTDPAQLAELGGDKWFASRAPDAAVFPSTVEEVSMALRMAHDARVPVTTRGSAYGYVGGCVPVRGGLVLSTARMAAIREISREDFVAVVEPGVITGELQREARRRRLFYPPDPASLKHCSIGGNIATNAGGPRCLKYGVTRNYVTGLDVVLADGTLLRLGGRTHKNKTGFDLIGMFVGSEGLLGVVTEATLRLLPLPPARGTLSAGFPDMRKAAKAVQAVFQRGFLPAAVEVADAFTLAAARKRNAPALVPPGDAHLLIEIDGQASSVESELVELAALLRSRGATKVEAASGDRACERLWKLRRGFSESLKTTGLVKLNEDVVVPRGRLVDLVEFSRTLEKRSGFPIACFGHAGDGNIHVNIMAHRYHADPSVKRAVDKALDALFKQVLAWGGAITGEHGIGLAKLRWWEQAVPPENRTLHRRIKRALDGRGILNPGKFV